MAKRAIDNLWIRMTWWCLMALGFLIGVWFCFDRTLPWLLGVAALLTMLSGFVACVLEAEYAHLSQAYLVSMLCISKAFIWVQFVLACQYFFRLGIDAKAEIFSSIYFFLSIGWAFIACTVYVEEIRHGVPAAWRRWRRPPERPPSHSRA